MRLVVTGGGTGGHIYPAIAIADKFKAMDPENEILYIGCVDGIEKELVPKAGYRLELVHAKGVNRSNPKEIVKTGTEVFKGIAEATHILQQFKPDAVIGTGGYVCFPVVFAAQRLRIACFLHEQNAFPGLANRRLEKYVKKVFLGFYDAKKYFKDQKKTVKCGNPVRASFFRLDKKTAREKLGFGQDEFIVLSFGGSLGAQTINEVSYELMKDLNGRENTRMIFGTGKRYYEDVMKKIEEDGIELKDNIAIKSYIDDMDNVLMASDVVISRSGALSVAETTVCGKAAILIPSPNVTGNHQYYNARAIADRGGAILIEEKELSAEILLEEVKKLREDRSLLKTMGEYSRECAPMEALDIIYKGIIESI